MTKAMDSAPGAVAHAEEHIVRTVNLMVISIRYIECDMCRTRTRRIVGDDTNYFVFHGARYFICSKACLINIMEHLHRVRCPKCNKSIMRTSFNRCVCLEGVNDGQ